MTESSAETFITAKDTRFEELIIPDYYSDYDFLEE